MRAEEDWKGEPGRKLPSPFPNAVWKASPPVRHNQIRQSVAVEISRNHFEPSGCKSVANDRRSERSVSSAKQCDKGAGACVRQNYVKIAIFVEITRCDSAQSKCRSARRAGKRTSGLKSLLGSLEHWQELACHGLKQENIQPPVMIEIA